MQVHRLCDDFLFGNQLANGMVYIADGTSDNQLQCKLPKLQPMLPLKRLCMQINLLDPKRILQSLTRNAQYAKMMQSADFRWLSQMPLELRAITSVQGHAVMATNVIEGNAAEGGRRKESSCQGTCHQESQVLKASANQINR